MAKFENGYLDHYFPQWLMRNWCDDRNEIWCFDKPSQQIKKKGTTCFGREKDLNKSDIIKLDLEATVFSHLDNKHAADMDALLLYEFYGKQKRVSNNVMRFFIELCLWTSIRNKRVQGWTDINNFRDGVESDHPLHAWTDAELKKAIHLQFCKLCDDSVMETEIERLISECFYFFAVSDGKFITSDVPVQEFGNEAGAGWLGCKPVSGDECTLIMFPLDPSVMFVATRHQEYADCHRLFVFDQKLIDANYAAHINSDADELYFPYQIFDPQSLPSDRAIPGSKLANLMKKVRGVPCAIDLDHYKEKGEPSVIYSNWDGSSPS